MPELNPNHGVTAEMRHQWYKIAALLMFKLGANKVEITSNDIEKFNRSDLRNIVAHPVDRVLTLELVGEAEALRLVKQEGGKAQ